VNFFLAFLDNSQLFQVRKILCILGIDVNKKLPMLDFEPASSHKAPAFV